MSLSRYSTPAEAESAQQEPGSRSRRAVISPSGTECWRSSSRSLTLSRGTAARLRPQSMPPPPQVGLGSHEPQRSRRLPPDAVQVGHTTPKPRRRVNANASDRSRGNLEPSDGRCS